MKPRSLSADQARRIALAAQGLAGPRPSGTVRAASLRRVLDRIAIHQIDSINVLARAHYLPLFSRLGDYPTQLLDRAAWGRPRRLFEYWAHEASLLPLDLHPLMRWRMDRADRGIGMWGRLRAFAGERRAEAEALLARIAAEGPLAASDVGSTRAQSGWWEWSDAKAALEWLFWAGHVTTATRRGAFERVYDLTSRVLPAEALAPPTPSPVEARRDLLDRSAKALGVATAGDLRDYFRLKTDDAKPRIAELVDAGRLVPVTVEGWSQPAYVHVDASQPGRTVGQALLAPFDPLIWERSRAERLFGFHYRIEIYVPQSRRVHGYYVLPFLMNGRLVARVDLKTDRKAGVLCVRAAHAEPGAPEGIAERLAGELAAMARWLGLDRVTVEARGDLSERLAGSVTET